MSTDSRDYIVDRLLNATGAAEGSILPGRQIGEARVQSVASVTMQRLVIDETGTNVLVTWPDLEDGSAVAQYNVYLGDENDNLIGPYTFQKSPGEIQVPLENWGSFTIRVQTQLKNGQTSGLMAGPTATFKISRPVLFPTSTRIYVSSNGQSVAGSATLVAGTKTVACDAVTATCPIFLSNGTGWCRVSARVAGTSFTITSSDGADVSTIHYLVLTPSTT